MCTLMRFMRLLLIVAASAALVLAQDPDFTLKVDVSLVSLDVSVLDADDRPVTTLRREDFLVYENGELQQIRNFSPTTTARNVLLLVDRSGSMRSQWPFVVEALNRFMTRLRAQDQVSIVAFDS